MADPNLVDFYSNVAHFEKRRQKGYAFMAPGTANTRRVVSRKQRQIVRPLVMVAFCAFGLKGMIYHSVGAAQYNDRVAALEAGQGFDRLGGFMMRADPVTEAFAAGIAKGVGYFKK